MLYLHYCSYMFPCVICLDLRLGSTDSFWSPGHGLKRFSFVSNVWSFLLCDCSSTFFGEWWQFIYNNTIYLLSYDHIDPTIGRSFLCFLYVYVLFPFICLCLGASHSGNIINGIVYVSVKVIAPSKVLAMNLMSRHTLFSPISQLDPCKDPFKVLNMTLDHLIREINSLNMKVLPF